MADRYQDVEALRVEYATKEAEIRKRLREFQEVGRRRDRILFEELAFCLLAIQTRARICDAAVRGLVARGLLWSGTEKQISGYLHHRVRFHNHKARYIVRARGQFFSERRPVLRRTLERFRSPIATRAWLVDEVDGLGMKEASHFLRNIGRGEGLAILDRHVLRNLTRHGVLVREPKSLSPRRYLAIEERMRSFSEAIGIPLEAMDLVFWSRETGEIFK